MYISECVRSGSFEPLTPEPQVAEELAKGTASSPSKGMTFFEKASINHYRLEKQQAKVMQTSHHGVMNAAE
jgi:hypothetical protein